MFDSGIQAKKLIEDLKSEADVALEIPDYTYILWLNSLEQLLYSEFIREQNKITVANPSANLIRIASVYTPAGESPVRFEDIHTMDTEWANLKTFIRNYGSVFSSISLAIAHYFKVA